MWNLKLSAIFLLMTALVIITATGCEKDKDNTDTFSEPRGRGSSHVETNK